MSAVRCLTGNKSGVACASPSILTGERVQDHRVNVLTVVASESYEHFVNRLQGEIEKEYGKEGVPLKPGNARAKVNLKLRKNEGHYQRRQIAP